MHLRKGKNQSVELSKTVVVEVELLEEHLVLLCRPQVFHSLSLTYELMCRNSVGGSNSGIVPRNIYEMDTVLNTSFSLSLVVDLRLGCG